MNRYRVRVSAPILEHLLTGTLGHVTSSTCPKDARILCCRWLADRNVLEIVIETASTVRLYPLQDGDGELPLADPFVYTTATRRA